MLSMDAAARVADEWFAAWNAHDLEAVLAHYAEDVEFVSPFVAVLNGDERGVLHGKDALRAYFARAFERFPDLRFEPRDVLVGVDSITLSYLSVGGRRAAEVMSLGPDGRVVRVLAHYSEPAG